MSEYSPAAASVSASASLPSAPVSAALVPGGVPLDASGSPAGEACPPPLVWQEVLNVYRTESRVWELDRGSRRLTGRCWGNGPPLYLLNGFAGTSELYSLLIYTLRDSFRCVVFDTAAEPKSRRARPTVDDFADDVFAAADHLGDSAVCLFAPSFGAAVSLQAALKRPDRIAGLVLQHGFANRRLSWSERMLAEWYRGSRRSLQDVPWRRRVQELNHRRWFPPFDGTRFEFLVESTGKIPLADLVQKALAIHTFDLRDRLPQISCPVLLVRTEGQGAMEASGFDVLEKGLPRSKSEWLHSTGLHPYLTHPHRLAKLLKPFFLGTAP